MQSWGPLILVIMVFVANLPAVMQQWRTDRAGSIKTLWLMGAYALYIALGIACTGIWRSSTSAIQTESHAALMISSGLTASCLALSASGSPTMLLITERPYGKSRHKAKTSAKD